jgi:hypothetical protein
MEIYLTTEKATCFSKGRESRNWFFEVFELTIYKFLERRYLKFKLCSVISIKIKQVSRMNL